MELFKNRFKKRSCFPLLSSRCAPLQPQNRKNLQLKRKRVQMILISTKTMTLLTDSWTISTRALCAKAQDRASKTSTTMPQVVEALSLQSLASTSPFRSPNSETVAPFNKSTPISTQLTKVANPPKTQWSTCQILRLIEATRLFKGMCRQIMSY